MAPQTQDDNGSNKCNGQQYSNSQQNNLPGTMGTREVQPPIAGKRIAHLQRYGANQIAVYV